MRLNIILFLIIAIGIISYSNSLGGDFIWDDVAFVIYNDFIKDLRFIPMYFVSKAALAKGELANENYRPFLSASYAVDYFFWKLNPLGYHISNLFFHIANAILVFYLVLLLTENRFISLLASLFFLTHPIQTESVTWISGRADVLFLFFYLAALIAYINYRKRGAPPARYGGFFFRGKPVMLYFVSLLLFSCSLLSKEMAASFPLIIILYDFFYSKKEKLSQKAIRYFCFFLILEVYVIIRFNVIGKLAQCDYWTGHIYTTFLSMARGVGYYIRLLVYPVNLCADYLTFPASESVKDAQTFISIAAIILLITSAIKLGRLHRHMSFSIFWFFITLAPAANIIPIQILIAERFLYLPSVGYCIIIAVLVVSLFDKFKRRRLLRYSIGSFAVLLLCAYSYLTTVRNTDWSDEVIFNKKIIAKYPDNYRARLNLSVAYYNKGDIDRSYEEAKKAIKVAPEDYPFARGMLARYYMRKDRLDDAIKEYKQILKIDPTLLQAHISLAIIYEHHKKYDLAFDGYKKALALDPDSLNVKMFIATHYLVRGDTDLSIREFNKILKEPPPFHYRSVYAAACLRLGELYFNTGDNESAIRIWRKVCQNFRDQLWFNEIAQFLIGKTSLEELLRKIELWQPDFKIICYYYVGMKKEMEGDMAGAKIYYRKTIELVTCASEQIRLRAIERLAKLEKGC